MFAPANQQQKTSCSCARESAAISGASVSRALMSAATTCCLSPPLLPKLGQAIAGPLIVGIEFRCQLELINGGVDSSSIGERLAKEHLERGYAWEHPGGDFQVLDGFSRPTQRLIQLRAIVVQHPIVRPLFHGRQRN